MELVGITTVGHLCATAFPGVSRKISTFSFTDKLKSKRNKMESVGATTVGPPHTTASFRFSSKLINLACNRQNEINENIERN